VLTIEAKKEEVKEEATDNYIHRGIAQRAFSKMFRLAEYMKVDDAQFVDGILTVFLYREIPEADKSRQITINTKAKSLPKAASA
jgi:molecular chaperone IbpA